MSYMEELELQLIKDEAIFEAAATLLADNGQTQAVKMLREGFNAFQYYTKTALDQQVRAELSV